MSAKLFDLDEIQPRHRARWLRWLVLAFCPWREIYRLQFILDRIAETEVYPKKIIGGPNAYEKRTDYMEGWNDSQSTIFRRWREAMIELNGEESSSENDQVQRSSKEQPNSVK